MNRRDFLRRSALVAAGAVAGDQLELLERVGRRFFPGFGAGVHRGPYTITSAQWDALLRESYLAADIEAMTLLETPFKAKLEGKKILGPGRRDIYPVWTRDQGIVEVIEARDPWPEIPGALRLRG